LYNFKKGNRKWLDKNYPTGQEALIPIQVYSCGNCGRVPKMFLEGSGLGEEINKPKEDALSRPDLEWADSKGI